MAELADARDSKSRGANTPCGFDSRLRHTNRLWAACKNRSLTLKLIQFFMFFSFNNEQLIFNSSALPAGKADFNPDVPPTSSPAPILCYLRKSHRRRVFLPLNLLQSSCFYGGNAVKILSLKLVTWWSGSSVGRAPP